MVFNRDQVALFCEEMERGISLMISQGDIETENELKDARALTRKWACDALITAASNWEEVVHWIDEIER